MFRKGRCAALVSGGSMPQVNSILAVAWYCLLEARPIVQIVFLLRLLSGWALTVMWSGNHSIAPMVFGIGSCFCVVMAVYLLNGVADQREDRINASRRPIARGRLESGTASRVAWLLAVIGVVAGFAATAPLGVLMLLALAAGWLYSVPSWRLKRRSSGTVSAALTGMLLTYYAGAVIAAAQSPVPPYLPWLGLELLVFGGALSLWTALVGGTTKDLPDLAGDRLVGSRSWLVVWGERRFRWAVSAIALLIGAGFAAVAIRLAPALVPVAGVLCAGAVTVSALLLVPLGRSRGAPGPGPEGLPLARAPYRAFMSTQYAAHLVLLVRQLTAMVW
jgi:4-hydroxybenzoate polyprenyltransferase